MAAYTTFGDLVEHLLAYAGKDATRAATADYRRAVLGAYVALATAHEWEYYFALGRVTTNGSQATGTVAYDHTGGANERQLTLSGATWPAWAAYGYVVIGNVPYEVDTRVSDTIVTLAAAANPGADLASGTAYTLDRDTYSLPADFVQGDETIINDIGTMMEYVHPRSWSSPRRSNTGPGRPLTYTLTGDPEVFGGQAIRLWPPPDAAYNLDMLYRRRPRALVYDQVADGSVSVTANSTTVTGGDTRFVAAHVGSVIRVSPDAVNLPTGRGGGNPFATERRVLTYTSATSLEVDVAFDTTLSGVKYSISDPADIDPDAHSLYLLREVEKQWRLVSRTKPTEMEMQEYELALLKAREANAKHAGRRAPLRRQSWRSGLRNYPISFSG